MKKGVIALIVLAVIVGLFLLGGIVTYVVYRNIQNNLVTKSEDTRSKWAEVETQYQRRLDLFNNVVNTIKGSANFEKSTLEAVVDARSKATSVTVDASKLSPQSIQQYQQAQSSSLSRMLLVVEQYPQLQTTQAFKDFQDYQIEGTENRVGKAREDFNNSVQDYNTYIKKFPVSLFSGRLGYTEKGYFKAVEGSEKAPDVNFPSPDVKQ